MLAGIFVSIFSLAIAGQKTFITKIELSKILAFFSLVWFVVPLKYYSNWFKVNKLSVFLLGALGVGPLIVSALLWTNFLVIKETHVIEYPVIEVIPESYNVGNEITTILYELDYDSMFDHPEFRRFDFTGDPSMLKVKSIKYTFGKGVLGYDVIKERELLLNEN